MGIDDDNGAGTPAGPDDKPDYAIRETITFNFTDAAQQQRFHDRLDGVAVTEFETEVLRRLDALERKLEALDANAVDLSKCRHEIRTGSFGESYAWCVTHHCSHTMTTQAGNLINSHTLTPSKPTT